MQFAYEVTSTKKFMQAVADLKQNLLGHKFGVLWELDVQETLAEKGISLNKQVMILEVCNPKKAKEVLEEEMSVAYFLPCKIVVSLQDGETVIGMVKPSVFMEMLQNPKLREFAVEVESTLKGVLDETV